MQQEGRILHAWVQGPWNLDLVLLFREQAQAFLPALAAQGPWGMLIEFDGDAVCPLDATLAIHEMAEEHSRNWQRFATAYVVGPQVGGYQFMNRVWHGIYQQVGSWESFDALDAALDWIHARLDDAAAPPVQRLSGG
jgi:hypothetical protein